MSRVIRIAALSLLSVSFAAPPVALPSVALAKPLDGEATPAACGPLGFDLGQPAPVAAPPVRRVAPPPVNIPPTRKEDRVEYTGPPVILPGPPPPPCLLYTSDAADE